MRKIAAFILSLAVLAATAACGAKSAYEHEVYKNAVKNRSENSARQGMMELDRETR